MRSQKGEMAMLSIKRIAVLTMAGLVLGTTCPRGWAVDSKAAAPVGVGAAVADVGDKSLFQPLRLPFDLEAPEVEGVSPTADDLRLRKDARSLLTEAATRIERNGNFSDSREKAEWDDGVKAYTAGRYFEAIAHFHAELER
jgi:hypothetical protein